MTTSPKTRSTFSAICVSNGVVRVRARATVGPRNFVDYSRASASHSNPVVFLPTCGGGPLRRSVEPTRTLMAPLLRSFNRVGPTRLICNLRGAFQALRSLLLRSLVQHPEKSGRSVFHGFRFAPVPLCAVAHASNMHRGASENAEIKAGNVRNVVR